MHRVRKRMMVAAGAAVLTLVAGACGSNSPSTGSSGSGTSASTGTSSGTSGSTSPSPGSSATGGAYEGLTGLNGGGTPKYGGTLTLIGNGDVTTLDTAYGYYTITYQAMRMYTRQLYTYPATEAGNTSVVPDLATAMPAITDGGLTYTIHIRPGIMWDTSPPRQVTAADFVLGVKRLCNPTAPFGGQPDYSDILAGYAQFCAGFAKVSATSASAQKAYIMSHNISGVSGSGETITIHLLKPATYFTDILTLPPFSPVPAEYLNYLPNSPQLQQHTISDGPYKVLSYSPTKSIVFVRNPVWKASTDPIRKAYVNEIKVDETVQQQTAQEELSTNTEDAMEWNDFPPPSDLPSLIATKNPDFALVPSYSTNPYDVFNTAAGPLKSLKVRQALEYGINRAHLIQNNGGPKVAPALTHVLPAGIVGASPNFNMYPYNPSKAKALLGGQHITLTFMYQAGIASAAEDFQTLQADLKPLGITVKGVSEPSADLFGKILPNPAEARKDVWDIAEIGWIPDWFGNAAKSFFNPLFNGAILPPTSNNDGLFNSPAVNADITKALASTTLAQAATDWHQADVDTMKGAAIYPVTDAYQPLFHSSLVHNCVYVPEMQGFDPTNVWLSNA